MKSAVKEVAELVLTVRVDGITYESPIKKRDVARTVGQELKGVLSPRPYP